MAVTFRSSYNTEYINPKESQSLPSRFANKVKEGANSVMVWLGKKMVFPGSCSKYKNVQRLERTNQELTRIGADQLKLETMDGTQLEGMYFDVEKMRTALRVENAYNRYNAYNGDVHKYFELPDNTHSELLVNSLELDHQATEVEDNDDLYKQVWNEGCRRLGRGEVYKKKVTVYSLGPVEFRDPEANLDNGVRPTVIICPGSGCNFQMLKKSLIPGYLKRGINVMVVNYQGYGQSKGSPSERGLSNSAETAYQYLRTVKNLPNNKIIVHGHCLGSAPAIDVARNHEGVTLILDRPIANYRDAAGDSFVKSFDAMSTKISPKIPRKLHGVVGKVIRAFGRAIAALVRLFSRLIGRFDNEKKIKDVKGPVLIIHDRNDETLSESHHTRLIQRLEERPGAPVVPVITTNKGHSGTWIDDQTEKTRTETEGVTTVHANGQFDMFLRDNRLLGSLY